MIRFASGAVRAVGETVTRRAGEIKSQAPGARMVGEFAVRSGVREIARRLGTRDSRAGGSPE